jgi:hypothetical protein
MTNDELTPLTLPENIPVLRLDATAKPRSKPSETADETRAPIVRLRSCTSARGLERNVGNASHWASVGASKRRLYFAGIAEWHRWAALAVARRGNGSRLTRSKASGAA